MSAARPLMLCTPVIAPEWPSGWYKYQRAAPLLYADPVALLSISSADESLQTSVLRLSENPARRLRVFYIPAKSPAVPGGTAWL